MLHSKTIDGLQLDLLRTFVVVAGARTFAEAAGIRRVTTSAISQQIRALEGQLGLALFQRVGRRAFLTDEGKALFAQLKEQLLRIEETLAAATQQHTSLQGRVAIGSPRTFGAYWLRPRLLSLVAAHPELNVEVEFGPPDLLERRLLDGVLDLTILVRPSQLPGITTRPLYRQTYLAVASTRLVGRSRPTTLDAFSRLPYVVFDREQSMQAAWWRTMFGARARLPQRIVCQVASLDEMMAFVEAGAAVAVLPQYYVAEALAARRIVSIGPDKRSSHDTVFLAWRDRAVETRRLATVRAALAAPSP